MAGFKLPGPSAFWPCVFAVVIAAGLLLRLAFVISGTFAGEMGFDYSLYKELAEKILDGDGFVVEVPFCSRLKIEKHRRSWERQVGSLNGLF